MDVSEKCKNLLCEHTCEYCANEEEDFKIIHTKQFPYEIPELHRLLLIERQWEGNFISITAYIKDYKILIANKDWSLDSKYLIHFRYFKCIITHQIIPSEMTCKNFKPITNKNSTSY